MSRARLTKLAILLVNAAIIVALLYWARDSISLYAVMQRLGDLPSEVLLSVLALNALAMVAYAYRLLTMLHLKLGPALATVMLGFGLNGILPLRLGEVVKIAYAFQLFRIAPARLMAASGMEKFLDLAALMVVGVLAVLSTGEGSIQAALLNVALLLSILLVCGGLGFVVVRILPVRGRLAGWLSEMVQTVLAQMSPGAALRVSAFTAIIWGLAALTLMVMFSSLFQGFGSDDALLLLIVIALAVAIPGTPAGLGAVEAGIVGYLSHRLAVDANDALAAALAYHALIAGPQVLTAVGLVAWSWWRPRVPVA